MLTSWRGNRKIKIALTVVALLALAAGVQLTRSYYASAFANEKSDMLVSTAWLGEHLGDTSLVILNIGTRASYDAGHIPGARFIEMSKISVSQPLTLEMPPVEKLKSAFESLGVSDNSRIVICFSENWVSPSTRV